MLVLSQSTHRRFSCRWLFASSTFSFSRLRKQGRDQKNCNLWKHFLHLKRFVKNEHVSYRVGEVSPSSSNSVLLHHVTQLDTRELMPVVCLMCYSGQGVLLCSVFCLQMQCGAPQLVASIRTPGTLLSRCSSPKSRVLLSEGTWSSNFTLLYVPLCTFLHTTQLCSSL